MRNGSLVWASLVVVSSVTACASETQDAGTVAALDDTLLDTQDVGNSWNGWTHQPYVTTYQLCGSFDLWSTFSRSYGDSTRGGGACLVLQTSTTCSDDSTCTSAAQSQYGSGAYGYCWSGTCYNRPGGQSTFCALGPNRSPGVLHAGEGSGWYGTYTYTGYEYVYGCMTKTAGPNTWCGSTATVNPNVVKSMAIAATDIASCNW